jgi:hypothetical protein
MRDQEKPSARREDVVVKELDGEVLVYDLRSNQAFCLNETSALVWEWCDGRRTVSEIADALGKKLKTPHGEELVWLALGQLIKESLLGDESEIADQFEGMTRRQIVKKIGLASMVAIPLVSSIIAPPAARASSVGCTFGNGSPDMGNQGDGGLCFCPRNTAINSTCDQGLALGTNSVVRYRCKEGCTCTRTQSANPSSPNQRSCSPGGVGPTSPSCSGSCG